MEVSETTFYDFLKKLRHMKRDTFFFFLPSLQHEETQGAASCSHFVTKRRAAHWLRIQKPGGIFQFSSVQFSSVAQSCPTLCNPMNCSTPGLPVHHHLPEFTQTHVHLWVTLLFLALGILCLETLCRSVDYFYLCQLHLAVRRISNPDSPCPLAR